MLRQVHGMPDLRAFLCEQHAHSHAAALSAAPAPFLTDQVLAGLGEAQLRARPAPGLNTIAWLLWHLARSEDVLVNVVLGDGPQVLDAQGWGPRLGLARRDMGTGNTAADVAAISERVAIAPLLAYRDAVGRSTLAFLAALRPDDWDAPLDPARLLAAGAFGDPADGARRVETYWRGRDRRHHLAASLAAHNYQHLGEALCIRSLVVRG